MPRGNSHVVHLEEELAAAEANLAVAKKRMEISKKLAQQNFSAPLEQVQLKADFENARVTLAKIRLKQNFQANIEVSQNTARLEAARSSLSVLTSQLMTRPLLRQSMAGWRQSMSMLVSDFGGPGSGHHSWHGPSVSCCGGATDECLADFDW